MPVETPHPTWQRYAFARKGEVSEVATAFWRETERNLRPKRR